MNFDAPRSISKKMLFKKNITSNDVPILTTNYNSFIKKNNKAYEILNSFQDPNVYRVYPAALFCNTLIKNKCVANDKQKLFYYDDHHLSVDGSIYVVSDITMIIKKIRVKNE
jgi:hypothetical protein